jgi:hypothetical protein
MAVAFETSLVPINVTFNQAGETETHPFDAGSGANRVLLVGVAWRDRSNVLTGVTYNGVAMSIAATGAEITQGPFRAQMWTLANPASGSNNLAVTMGAGSDDALGQIGAMVVNGADIAGTPVEAYDSESGAASTANVVSAVTISSVADDRVVCFHFTAQQSDALSSTATNFTERQDANDGGNLLAITYGDADGAATVATQATWNNGAFKEDWIALGINVNATGGAAETITLDKWQNTMPSAHKRVIGMVPSGMIPPNRAGS